MKFKLFVLDLDKTYSGDAEESIGVAPGVYLVDAAKIDKVAECARFAAEEFHNDPDGIVTIGDLFEEGLEGARVTYCSVGNLEITVGQRQGDYLDKEIELVVV